MKKFLKKAEGFTLVELIVVIAILGILTAVAVPAYTGYIEKSKEAGDVQAVGAVLTAAQGAMALEGTIDEVRVDLKNSDICAVQGKNIYILRGDAIVSMDGDTDMKEVVAAASDPADPAEFVDPDLTTIKSDFETFMGTNTVSFKAKAPTRGGTNGAKDVANFAIWKAATGTWTFEHIA